MYWIWMSLAFGPANINAHKLLQRYPNPRDLYEAVQRIQEPLAPLTPKEYENVRSVTLEKARAVMEECVRKHIDVVNMTEQRFPQRLLHIYNPPILLYILGRYLPFNERLVITMVGSREVTTDGYEVGRKIAYELARREVIVVSGMALGGDSSAHIGALQANGSTAAVIACGCDINYPVANRELHVQVALNGCILSEYPPGVRPEPRNFIMRNRILAGLANGVVVTECRQRSGALSTANYALEEGRDIFAVPNSALDERHGGTFGLLQDGAVPVRKAEDIIAYYDTVRGVPVTSRNVSAELRNEPAGEVRRGKGETRKSSERKNASNPLPEKGKKQDGNSSISESMLNTDSLGRNPSVKQSSPEPPVAAEKASLHTKKVDDAPDQTEKDALLGSRENASTALPQTEETSSQSDPLGDVSETARLLYPYLTQEPQYIESLITASGLNAASALASLTELECIGLCKSLPGQRYLLP